MRIYGLILSTVLLMAMVFFPGCIMQESGGHPAPPAVNGAPSVTLPSPTLVNVYLPVATPTPRVVYVTVPVPVTGQVTGLVPVLTPTLAETVCNATGIPAAGIGMIGGVSGLASAPEAGIDEIRFTMGLDPCSPALDLTKVQIVFSIPGTFPVTLTHGTRTSTGFFTTKTGTSRVTFLNPGDQVEVTFYVAPLPAGTTMNIEIRPPGGAAVPLIKTAPARISATNILS